MRNHPVVLGLRGRWRRRLPTGRSALTVAATAVAGALAFGPGAPAASASACPNATIRTLQGAEHLPECRAYEQVSVPDKVGSDAQGGVLTADGEHVTYGATGAFADAPRGGANAYLATRTSSGWQTRALTYPLDPAVPSMAIPPTPTANADGSMILLQTAAPLDPVDLDGDSINSYSTDFYLRAADASLTWLSRRPAGFAMPTGIPYTFFPAASTDDLDHILWNTDAKLLPATAGLTDSAYGLYDWTGGAAHLVNVDSSGALVTPYGAAFGGGLQAKTDNALSRDGARIYFTTPAAIYPPPSGPDTIKRIYLRQSGTTTTEISASQCTIAACAGPELDAIYQGAAADGSVAFFTSAALLTDDATTGGGLYRYDVASGKLALITRDATDPDGAQVQGEVANSDDGKRVYFVAKGVLATGAALGANNLYLYDAATSQTTFVTALAGGDSAIWTSAYGSRPAEATPSGRQLIFQSVAPLAPGYDNAGHSEVYRYEMGAPAPVCLSCVPAGTPATGNTTFTPYASLVHNISDDGSRVFFQSSSSLVPLDVNGKIDVYEWHDGDVSLLTSGTGSKDASFTAASASGRDVLVTTYEQLVAQDGDDQTDVYDIRIGGGMAPPPPPPARCAGDSCRGAVPAAPSLAFPASASFSGEGNVASAPTASGQAATLRVARVTVRQARRWARTGRVVLRARVSTGGRVKAIARGRVGKRLRTVARAVKTARHAGTVRLALRLSKAARHELERHHRLRVTITVSSSKVHGVRRARLTLSQGRMHAAHASRGAAGMHRSATGKGRR